MTIVLYRGERKAQEGNGRSSAGYTDGARSAEEVLARYTLDQVRSWKTLDLYYILGLRRSGDTDLSHREIRDAYKKQAAKFHPDSLEPRGIADEGLLFVALTRALQTLSDPVRKKLYDCFSFDESLPKDREYGSDEFFGVFTEVFERNACFSAKKNVPILGTPSSSAEEVRLFYKFWQAFESTRSFDFLCEDEDCPNRESRRQIARQNKQITEEKKMEDNARIRRLVALAIKNDPRIAKRQAKKENDSQQTAADEDGWTGQELALMKKLSQALPPSRKNRVDQIHMSLEKIGSKKTKREVLGRLVKTDLELRSRKAKT
jgi:DnaJ homolog subfamily C member 2